MTLQKVVEKHELQTVDVSADANDVIGGKMTRTNICGRY